MDTPPVKVTPQGENASIVEVTVPVAAPEGAQQAPPPTATHLARAITVLVDELLSRVPKPEPPPKAPPTWLEPLVKWTTIGLGVLSAGLVLFLAPSGTWRVPGAFLQAAVFGATATLPHFLVEKLARLAERLSPDLAPGDHVPGFKNVGTYVGIFERALFLGALVTGYPEFIGVWFVFKGIAGYRVGLPEKRARRTFQLFLLNNATSLAGVALGLMLWKLLGLPMLKR